jgi:Fe-S-cluster-containing dehydrogenase component
MMSQYGMIIDLNKCSGCYNCFLACRDEHFDNDYSPIAAPQPFKDHFWMQIAESERGKYPKVKLSFIPKSCMHCDDAPCIRSAENGAVYKRADGIVIIDPQKSAGQKQILSSCPHRVIFWNEEKKIPQKCTFCAHLLDAGDPEPRCVEACPTGALQFGDVDDEKSDFARLWNSKNVEVLHPEFDLKPRVKYIGIPKRFVAGSIYFKDRDQCAENAKVTLTGHGIKETVRANNYGDFEFEGLGAAEDFHVKVESSGYVPQSFKVQTQVDVYLGDILLKREAAKAPKRPSLPLGKARPIVPSKPKAAVKTKKPEKKNQRRKP